ncbi:hypothetical protein F3Y22_tig00111131pilonHSYRG00171 [Hibiscus syriacus]|uniref:5'-3' exonuclease domain-containing protein n=1 Tax=Hibiscus syriacus TaxID=106335 RepID=A0A6A2YZT0_HIBSY|nr:hypothetical protein F3Y22_tig00111131pilonHSYRG00171 [Hibiscus syriacus]
MAVVTLAARIFLTPCLPPNPFRSVSSGKSRTNTTEIVPQTTKSWKIKTVVASSSSPVVGSFNQTVDEQVLPERECLENEKKSRAKKRVFFLDVKAYNLLVTGFLFSSLKSASPTLLLPFNKDNNGDDAFAIYYWCYLSSNFEGWTIKCKKHVEEVFDGENCNEKWRQLLPSYKAHRRKFFPRPTASKKYVRSKVGGSQKLIMDVLRNCNVPVLKVYGNEADDVVATLVEQVLERGYRVLDRWSFYTLKHYIAQYNCDPHSDLSLRCIVGDEVDGVPGIQRLIPGFGRRTALKLLKKHGSLENLLNAASVRTVGKQYAQEALTKYADYLRRNYEVLALRRLHPTYHTGMLTFIFKKNDDNLEIKGLGVCVHPRLILIFKNTFGVFRTRALIEPSSNSKKIRLELDLKLAA